MKLEKLSNGRFIKTSIIVLAVISIFGVIFINKSKAKYRVTQSIQIVSGEVNYKVADLNVLAIYKQKSKENTNEENYESISDVPTSGYQLNTTKSYCTKPSTNDTKITGDIVYDGKSISVNNITEKGTKCYLYFDINNEISSEERFKNLGLTLGKGTPNFSKTACSSGCGETTNGVYTAQDDFGTSYYFRGTVSNNWVKFGKVGNSDIYWRIVRINGNGTIRLIYSGTGTAAATGDGTQLKTLIFNSLRTSAMSVKYLNSAIQQDLDYWYDSNLKSYANKIDGATGFCNDVDYGTASGSDQYFKPYDRIETNHTPSLKCELNNLYTTSGGTKGNQQLTNPIGLISADEVNYAGGVSSGGNSSYYLYTNQEYWTLSPAHFDGLARMFFIYSDGEIMSGGMAWGDVNHAEGVRPVINLKADTTFTGHGTSIDPYILSGN